MKETILLLLMFVWVSVVMIQAQRPGGHHMSERWNPQRWGAPRRTYTPNHRRSMWSDRKPPTLTRPRRFGKMLVGPHVCGDVGQRYCCPGWTTSASSNRCLQPVCTRGQCGDGVCAMPKECICPDGKIKKTCDTTVYRAGECMLRCMNGGKCVENECACTDGYTGAHCGQPVCGPGCLNSGRCVGPNKCICTYGFTGDRCQTDYRVGPCFLTRANDTCMDQVPGVMCNKNLCCATIGQGWGVPCEECPARVKNCTRGRMPPKCDDINECQMIPGLCKDGTCVNTDGSFRCDCSDGYTYDTRLHQCVDIDECAQGLCENGECTNTVGGFLCKCPPDYRLSADQTYCISDVPGFCYTSIKSGMCADPLERLTRRTECCCVLVGQQKETLGKCFAVPNHTPERCAAVGTPEFKQACLTDGQGPVGELDICTILGVKACVNGICVPDGGGDYQCQCDSGFISTANMKECVDLNECGDGTDTRDYCGPHGTCVNTIGSYTCHCDPGFANSEDMTDCLDIDECEQEGLCEYGICINTRGSFRCSCDEGYRVTPTQQACEDYDECVERSDLCEHGRCLNIKGSFRCVCNPGYNESDDLKECVDENECETTGMCEHGQCINSDGGFECSCDNGYELTPNGKQCRDIDECIAKPCVNGECENLLGNFICHCHKFQKLDITGRVCVLDETTANCYREVHNGQCTKVNALPTLTTRAQCCCVVPGGTSAWDDCEPCPEVNSLDHGVLCTNIKIPNMCAMYHEPCTNGVCINMAGNDYRCDCNPGFVPSEDLKACRDIDECHENMMLCSNGECRNTPGSFVCTCDNGFVLRGDVCEDIDECLSNPCTNGDCINTPGSLRCECDENSMIDIFGRICYDVQLQQCWKSHYNGTCQDNVETALTVEECCNSIGVAWGNVNCRPCTEFSLKCPKGYKYDIPNDECIDIDECSFGGCDDDAECVNTVGSYRCVCPKGLTLDTTGTVCLDLRVGTCFYDFNEITGECQNPTAGADMRKKDCCCNVGFGWGDPCEGCPIEGTTAFDKLCPFGKGELPGGGDYNECINFPDLCENGKCENTASSFLCHCNNGYTLDESGRTCVDIEECEISPELCGNGVCVNTEGSFKCDCEEGHVVSAAGDHCEDFDECLAGGRCTGGDCHNTIGSYECTCPDGRALSDDGTKCVDIDECAVMKELCQPNGECVNMLGFFLCVCNPGFESTEDQQSCVDIDECTNDNGGCSTICINMIGSYECRCDEGYSLTYDGHTCADFDECLEQSNRCDGGRCENIDGSFRCICFDGFMATMDLQYCEDIDECAMNPNICMNGKCHNTRGSYTCNCDPGYCVPQGQMICVDEDECQLGKHTCDVNADCSNTEGSFDCLCIAGFTGDGYDCEDQDECLLGNDTCDINAFCDNTHGSFACECADGFFGDGYTCSDKDDCLMNENLCGPHGECLNIQGSFECECPMGFMTTADRKACKDIDECAIEHICVNGRCHNVPGTFRCECLTGYEKDEQGANCSDIDECYDVANCINGECVNSVGSYECQCPEGFTSNPTGVGCVDVRKGDCFLNVEGNDPAPICSHPIGIGVSRAGCCCSYGQGWGNPCEFCPEENTTEFFTLCPGGNGFKPNPITVLLEDIDECMELPGLCQGGKCINVFGSFICECPEGYALNEKNRVCEDVDECTEDEVCGPGTCMNSVGGFSCLCPEGYKPINKGRVCEDQRMSFCYRDYNESSLQCSIQLPFNVTKKLCCCSGQIGAGWNNPCEVCPVVDTDDFETLCGGRDYTKDKGLCKKIPKLCLNGICVDTEDDYRCECLLGFRFNEDLLICEDIDECAVREDICQENAQCVNLDGSFRCRCRDGFTERNEECYDIDECEEEGACSNGNCENTEGGFICDCNQGFKPINGDEACEDIDECEHEPCGHGTCQNMIGSFICACDNGFTLSDNGDCVDIDECDETNICRSGTCVNEPGTFSCICDDGYKVSPDGRSCLDSNECAETPEICGAGTCQNMDGAYKCYCPTGYSSGPDDSECVDENECDLLDMCKFGQCINNPGSFYCVCPEMFVLSSNKKFCIDLRRGTCYNEYEAGTCSAGLPSLVTRGSCCCRCTNAAWGESEDDCDACPAEGTDAFRDLCPDGCGFTPDGGDINECLVNDPCVNGRCRNLAGGFKCECREGFKLDSSGVRCVDENECVERDYPCGPGLCTNRDGGFECKCDEGYYNGPEMKCLDTDECAQNTDECAFRCQNTEGGFVCVCPEGFELREDKKTCQDIDECSEADLNHCEEKGMTCKNHIGYFACLCPSGFKRVGISDICEDIDECERTGVCAGGVCVNLEGTYQCRCDEGFEYDEQGRRCIDARHGQCYAQVHQRTCEITATTGNLVSKTDCCCNKQAAWGMDCELCPHVSSKEFVEMCPHGPGFTPNGEDINDCVVIPGLCVNGTCTNLLGSFKCVCDRGFMPTPNLQECIDIDECSMPNGCAGGSRCLNTIGAYKCVCPTGYQITNTMRCVDIDECARKEHACQFICINTVGSYHCGCPRGFAMHMNESCVDKNECEGEPDICGKNAECVNDVGGYHCQCDPGYEKNAKGDGCVGLPCDARPGICGPQMCMNLGDSIRCVPGCNPNMRLRFQTMRCYDIHDCRASPCRMGSSCMPNAEGQFRCGCSRGFTRMGGNSGCGDINECRFQNNPCSFGCQNTFGSFKCGCPRGFFGLGGGHCMNGLGGFQQPMYPPAYPQMPYMGRPQQMGRCYDCAPPGPRQRRSIQAFMEEVSGDDENRPSVNTSLPIILKLNMKDLAPRQRLLRLLPALRILRDHTQYRISEGNEAGMFRIHKRDGMTFIHINRGFQASEGPIIPGKYKIKVEAKPTLKESTIKKTAMNNAVVEKALKNILKFDVEFDIDK